MPQAAGVAVVGWMGAAGATATVAAAAGAIASAAVLGAITGAVIGAAGAAMSGGDIFKGALKGALIGGVSGGVLKGAGILTGISPVGSAFTNAAAGTNASAQVGGQVGAQTVGQNATGIDPNYNPVYGADGSVHPGMQAQPDAGILSGTPPPVEKASSILNSPAAAGATEGFGTGVALAGGQLMATKAEEDIEEMRQRQEEQFRSQNVPGEFESKTANITPPNWWDAHLNPNLA